MKTTLAFSLFILLSYASFAQTATDTKIDVQSIAQNAEVANGGTEVKTYDAKTLNADQMLKTDLASVRKEYGRKCGPYITSTDVAHSIQLIRDDIPGDKVTADALDQLNQKGQILKMYSITTNNEIDCSRSWVEVFTTDGQLLELYYGMND
jgi:hypothetical protein